jgi:TonB family protein
MGYTIAANNLYDEEIEQAGRILSLSEFIDRIKARGDIFKVDRNTLTGRIEGICLVSALIAGYLLSNCKMEMAKAICPDFLEPGVREARATVVPDAIERPRPAVTNVAPAAVERRSMRTPRVARGDAKPSGRAAGSPRERVARAGIFAMMSQQKIKGVDAAFGDIAGKGGFSETIDAALSGLGGLKQGSGSSSGRRGVSSLGFGKGYGLIGDGDGSGIDDIGSLSDSYESVELQFKGRSAKIKFDAQAGGGTFMAGGRSRNSIMAVVFQNLPALRYLYNNRLNLKPGLKGKITVKFAVDEFGNVLHCEVVESSIADGELEQRVVAKIRAWRFEKIDKPGDVTEIVYPFVFAAG